MSYYVFTVESCMSDTTIRVDRSTLTDLESYKIDNYRTSRVPNDVVISNMIEDLREGNEDQNRS